MYSKDFFYGNTLPPKTLCLTFDDGPGKVKRSEVGPHTIEIAKYLHSKGIRATFFVVGKYAAQYPDILALLKKLGHLIGNHTFDHPNLYEYILAGGDTEEQILRTDSIIKKWVDGTTIFLGPPYGYWSNSLADALNKSLLVSMNHVGPIHWNIEGGDWASVKGGVSVDETVSNYLNLIQKKDHGIILNHDCSADPDIAKNKNMTLPVIKKLIPKLKGLGYKFVRLDEINDIKVAANMPHKFALQASNGKYISLKNDVSGEIVVNGSAIGKSELISVVDIGFGKIALKASNGLFFSPQQVSQYDQEQVLANATNIGVWEPFDLIQLKSGKVAFRTVNGYYLSKESNAGDRLITQPKMGENEIFKYCPIL